jgi:hypothetical protein
VQRPKIQQHAAFEISPGYLFYAVRKSQSATNQLAAGRLRKFGANQIGSFSDFENYFKLSIEDIKDNDRKFRIPKKDSKLAKKVVFLFMQYSVFVVLSSARSSPSILVSKKSSRLNLTWRSVQFCKNQEII